MATLDLSITVTPDAKAQDILNTVTDALGWTAADGRTRTRFLKDEIIEYIRNTYVKQKQTALEVQTRTSIRDDVASFTMS